MSTLSLHRLSKSFQGAPAVQSISLTVQSGEILSLLGPSGCGKSTTLQMIAGVLAPDQGSIDLNARCLNRIPPERRGIALVLQRGLLFPHLTVGENVAFGLKMRGIPKVDREHVAVAMLQRVQLADFVHRKPAALSGGQAQRVALARALVIQPEVLLLDEPLSALDANLRGEMQELILDLQRQTGVTTVIVTHDQSEAMVMSDRIALMFEGRIHQVGSPTDFYQSPCSEVAARFFGGVNFWAGWGSGPRVELRSGPVLTSQVPMQGDVTVTIRPEQVQISRHRPPQVNVIPVKIVSQRFTGTQYRLGLRGPGFMQLQAWILPNQAFEVGESVWAYVPPDALWRFPVTQDSQTHAQPVVVVKRQGRYSA